MPTFDASPLDFGAARVITFSHLAEAAFGPREPDMCMLDTIHARRDEIYALARKHKAEKLWVFGSCARREETPESDVDFLVEFGKGSSLLTHVHLMNDFSGFFGKKVDVVSTRGIHPYIRDQVWKDAVAV